MNFNNVVNNIKYEFFQVKSAKLTWIINFVVPLVWLIPFLVICEWFGKKEYEGFYTLSILLWSNMRGIIFFIGLTVTKKKDQSQEEPLQNLLQTLIAKTIVHFPLLIVTNIITIIPTLILFGGHSYLRRITVKTILFYFSFLIFLYLLAYLINFLIYYHKKVRIFFGLYEKYTPFLAGVYYSAAILPLPLKLVCMLMPLTYYLNLIRANISLEPYLISYHTEYTIAMVLDVLMFLIVVIFYKRRLKPVKSQWSSASKL